MPITVDMRGEYEKKTYIFDMQKRGGGICELCCGEKERDAALSVELQAPLYGSHFVFFPALPNMELQS